MADFSTAVLRRAAQQAQDSGLTLSSDDTGSDVAQSAPPLPTKPSHAVIHGLLAAMAGGQVADALSTRAAIDRGGVVEGNDAVYGRDPSLPRLLATKAAVAGPTGYLIDRLYNTHPKLSLALAGLMTAAGVVPAIHNMHVAGSK